jgi:hypothetical protein
MRFGRLGVAALLVASALSFESVAFAQDGNVGTAKDGTRVGPKTTNPTYGPNGPGPGSGWEKTHQPREVWSRNSDPIVAERPNAPGKYYDARQQDNRTRGTLGKDAVADANERNGYYDQKNSVTIASGEKELWKESVVSGKAGEYNKETGNGAQVEACALCTDGKISGNAGITANGVQASGTFEAGAYLAKVEGEAGAKYNGAVVQGGVNAKGSAFVGAQVKGTGTVEISRERITANGKVGAFAGGKAEGQVSAEAGLTNVGTVKGTVMGEVSYGIGASAEGYFTVDWSSFTIKTGGRVSATLGVGAGVGFQTEISVKPAVDWVAGKAKAAGSAIANGASRAGSAIASGAKALAGKLCFWCKKPEPVNAPMPVPQQVSTGAAPPLNASTGSVAIAAQAQGRSIVLTPSSSDAAVGAGMAR